MISHQILLETSNPLDVTPDELQVLADELASKVADVDFVIGYFDQHGAGATWSEVLHVWLPDESFFRDAAWTYVLGVTGLWMKSRFRKKGSARRPKTISFYDSDTGRKIGEVKIQNEDQEISIELPSRADFYRNKPPKRDRQTGDS